MDEKGDSNGWQEKGLGINHEISRQKGAQNGKAGGSGKLLCSSYLLNAGLVKMCESYEGRLT